MVLIKIFFFFKYNFIHRTNCSDFDYLYHNVSEQTVEIAINSEGSDH